MIQKDELLRRTQNILDSIKSSNYEGSKDLLALLENDTKETITLLNEWLVVSEATLKATVVMKKFVDEKIKLGIDNLSIEQQLKQLDPMIDLGTGVDEVRDKPKHAHHIHIFFDKLKGKLKESFGAIERGENE